MCMSSLEDIIRLIALRIFTAAAAIITPRSLTIGFFSRLARGYKGTLPSWQSILRDGGKRSRDAHAGECVMVVDDT